MFSMCGLPASPPSQVRQAGLRAQVGAAHVDAEHQVEALHRRVPGPREADCAGVVDQDVDAAEASTACATAACTCASSRMSVCRQRLPPAASISSAAVWMVPGSFGMGSVVLARPRCWRRRAPRAWRSPGRCRGCAPVMNRFCREVWPCPRLQLCDAGKACAQAPELSKLHLLGVGPPARRAVQPRALSRASCASRLGGLPPPCLQRRILQRSPVREAQVPGLRPEPVHRVEVWRSPRSGVCPPDRKNTPGTAAGTVRRAPARVCAATSAGSPAALLLARHHHARLEQHVLERDAVAVQRVEDVVQHGFGHFGRSARWVWSPSISTSGSTMGTTPASWQIAA